MSYVATPFDEESFLIGFAVGRMLWKPPIDVEDLEQVEPEEELEQENAD